MQRPFEEATFALAVGEMSGVVDTDSGLHVILRLPLAAEEAAPESVRAAHLLLKTTESRNPVGRGVLVVGVSGPRRASTPSIPRRASKPQRVSISRPRPRP